MIETGGTIACTETENGLSPVKGGLFPSESFSPNALAEIETLAPFSLDSTDLTPKHWRTLYRAAREAIDGGRYDGIVILHGTDTLDYTTALLFHTLKTAIPVILTGSMLPMGAAESDGAQNLTDALLAARDPALDGVSVVFGGRIIDGDEAVKCDSRRADAFRSFSGTDRGSVRDGKILLQKEKKRRLICPYPSAERKIAVVKLSPFMAGAEISALSAAGYDGAVLEGCGAGGLPETLLPAARALTEKMPVVMTSPCFGGVRLGEYAVGRRALDCGIMDGGETTTADAAVKLYCGASF